MSPPLLDRFIGRVRLEGILRTATGLHIGAGGSGDPLASDSPVVRNAAGQPYIPGSSLKGIMRSAAEALFRGGTPADGEPNRSGLWACDQVSGGKLACVDHDEEKRIRERLQKEAGEGNPIDPRALAREVWDASCTVCRLFGSPALAGRARFSDLPLVGDMPFLELRNGVGINRDRELAAPGVLYDFEAVPPDTRFRLTVVVDNPLDAEVGLLLYLFDQLHEGNLALGGKTSRGLGRVRVDWQHIIETSLNGTNPFAELLKNRDLLVSAEREAPLEAPPEKSNLPETGDAEVWKRLAEMLEQMEEIDKTELGRRANEEQLTKADINQQLQLGLDSRRRVWDVVLERLVECGFLVEHEGRLQLASRIRKEQPAGPQIRRDEAFENAYERFVEAAKEWWEEMH